MLGKAAAAKDVRIRKVVLTGMPNRVRNSTTRGGMIKAQVNSPGIGNFSSRP